jgi:hypothetical protein
MRFPRLFVLIALAFSTIALHGQAALGTQGWIFSSTTSFITTSGIQNIDIPPIANAPFSATVLLQGAGRRSYERVARDSAGRVFEEHHSIVDIRDGCPYISEKADNCSTPEPWVTDLVYIDPVQHTAYDCTPKGHLCRALSYKLMAVSTQEASTSPTFRIAVKALGQKKIDGLQAIGSLQTIPMRQRIQIHPMPGNPHTATREVWYSPDLHIDLKVKHSFLTASESSQVKNLKRSEPNPKLFVPPAKYKLPSTLQP